MQSIFGLEISIYLWIRGSQKILADGFKVHIVRLLESSACLVREGCDLSHGSGGH